MIEPPKWAKDAIPTPQGWKHPKRREILLKRKFTQEQIDAYMAAKDWTPPPAPEVKVEPIPVVVEEVPVVEQEPEPTRSRRKKAEPAPVEQQEEEPRGFWPFPIRRP